VHRLDLVSSADVPATLAISKSLGQEAADFARQFLRVE